MIIQVLAKVGGLIFMLAVGGLARFRHVITDEALDSLCKIVLYVTLPFLFIYVLATRCNRDVLLSLWTAPFFAAAIVFTGFIIANIAAKLLRLPPKRKDAFTFLISFQNSGFLAIPIALVLFGQDGVLTIIIFNIGFNILYWTFGIWLFGRSNTSIEIRPLKNLINPAIMALALGILLGVLGVKLPKFFLDTSRVLGDATIPLAMLVVGAMLAGGKFNKGIGFREILSIVFCRLILVPVIFLGVIWYFRDISPLLRSIIILQACMPSASSSPLLAKRFRGDYDLAASGVFFTTLFSVITVPLFLSFAT